MMDARASCEQFGHTFIEEEEWPGTCITCGADPKEVA